MRRGQKACIASWDRFSSYAPALWVDRKANIATCPACKKPVVIFQQRNARVTDTIPSHKAWTDYDRSAALARCKGPD